MATSDCTLGLHNGYIFMMILNDIYMILLWEGMSLQLYNLYNG